MTYHPMNLALRFILELCALAAMARYGWLLTVNLPLRLLAAAGLPLLAAVLWGVFAVPDDRSRSGGAPVPVPGAIRLILELGFFGIATWALYATRAEVLSIALGGLVLLHYCISYERIKWLLGIG